MFVASRDIPRALQGLFCIAFRRLGSRSSAFLGYGETHARRFDTERFFRTLLAVVLSRSQNLICALCQAIRS